MNNEANSQSQPGQVLQIKSADPEVVNIREYLSYDNLAITCQDEYETAGSYLLNVKSKLKIVEEERQKIVAPLNTSLRNTNDFFKRVSDPLNKIKDKLLIKMGAYADAQRKRLEDEKRAQLKAQKEEFEKQAATAKKEAIELGSETALETANNFKQRAAEIDTTKVEVSQTMRLGKIGTVAERLDWTWEVTDITKVPREYLIIDEKRINAIAKAQGKTPQVVEGIRFFQKTNFAAITR